MAHAYTPGLKVTARTTLRKRRMLPLRGEVCVEEGAQVEAPTVVAQTELPGDVHPVSVVNRLGVRPEEIARYMLKGEGEEVREGEPIAETRPWIKWFKTVCRSPVRGSIEKVSEVTGQVMVREEPRRVQVQAYVAGRVAEVIEGEGAVIESEAALVQGIFGIGGETGGTLKMLAQAPDGVVHPEAIDASCAGCVLVVGALATAELVRAAREAGAAAVVGAGMAAGELQEVLGHEIGVAVTGSERIGLTVVLTEGFGTIPMARRTFELLADLEARRASVCGATQIRAGVVRPEVVVPLEGVGGTVEGGAQAPRRGGVRESARVRVIRRPHFGMIGEVVELVPELVRVESEARVRVMKVRGEGEEIITVPRANVEVIER